MESLLDFRRESARLVAGLTRWLGAGRLDLAEDAAQEALVRALHQWPTRGVPPSPSGWLMRVARNAAVDRLRREGIYAPEVEASDLEAPIPEMDGLPDDELRMLFLCVHPCLPIGSQIALTLKVVCGLGIREIARGLVMSEEAVSRRITRAKLRLAEAGAEFSIPVGDDAERRLEVVRRVLYLMFNEGYVSASGEALTNADVCAEALDLARRLSDTQIGDAPETHALVALMLLHTSRLPSRVGPNGELRLLQDQDRSLWSHPCISAGLNRLCRAAQGDRLSRYHAEAAIAACHATARDFDSTDWPMVLQHYDDLVVLTSSPIVRLNRAMAVSMAEGPSAAMAIVQSLAKEPKLARYVPFFASLAQLHERLGEILAARAAYVRALGVATNHAERAFLIERLARLDLVLEGATQTEVENPDR